MSLVSNKLIWSDEIFRIFEIDRTKFGATYEAFLNVVHPEDRKAVNESYTNSLKTRHRRRAAHHYLQQAAERIFGYSAEEINGRPLEILMPARFASRHRRHVSTFAGGQTQAREMGKRAGLD